MQADPPSADPPSAEPLPRVPVGPDARRWNTFRSERTLVVAARTVTSTVRVLECLPSLVCDDGRISVVFAYDPTSAFSDGVLDVLRNAGCRVMPWRQLGEFEPDLILSASENVDIPEGRCPVLVLPHGVGFQKTVPDSRSSGSRLSGMVSDALLESGRAWLAVSHPDQERQLLAAHAKTAGRTLLIGDPCFDELAAGLAQRAAYRRALGVGDDRRLVVVSSTWGPTSLIGREPHLPARLLASLPYDAYRVALILHPNVWAAHGAWQIRVLQASAIESGLILVPAVHSWRPALLAADLVIGDHGSVSLYGASLGIPLLLGAFGEDAVPGTASGVLSRTARRLDARTGLRRQVVDAIESPEPRGDSAVAHHAFAETGQAHARLRTALYELLRLPEPPSASPRPPALPPPEPAPGTGASPTALRVTTVLTETGDRAEAGDLAEAGEPPGRPVVTVDRVPAPVSGAGAEEHDTAYVHLACREDAEDRCLAESASVIVAAGRAETGAGAQRWAARTLDRFPGCLLAATGTDARTVLLGLRDGRTVTAEATRRSPDAPLHAGLDAGLVAAAAYTLLRAARLRPHTRVTLCVGERTEVLSLRLQPAGTAP